MSEMECPTCPKPKKIGFLIQIKGEQASGVPAEFVSSCFGGSTRSKEKTSSSANWVVRSQLDGDAEVSSLPILWEDVIKNIEIYKRKERDKQGWRSKDFVWFQITAQKADLLLFGLPLTYVPITHHAR